MEEFSSTPTFVRQAADTPISEIALRLLVELSDGETHVVGTATIVAGFLAITARHVLEDIVTRFGADKKEEHHFIISKYAIRLYQILPGPEYAVWNVVTAWPCLESDIAILHLSLHGYSSSTPPDGWKVPRIKVIPPAVNSLVVGFGYHSSKVRITPGARGYHLDINDEPTATTGRVEEILPTGNPVGKFNFPCVRVAARFDGGMSGGPVIDQTGAICGIISGTYGNLDGDPISYSASLGPILPTVITANRAGPYPRDQPYTIAELARNGLIHIEGFAKQDRMQS